MISLSQGDVLLRPPQLGDVDFYIALANRSDVRERVNNPIPYLPEHFDALLQLKAESPLASNWIILHNDQPCGVVTIASMRHPQVFQGGYWMQPEMWGRGIMTTAWRLAVDHLFSAHSARRVQAVVEPDNIASIRLLEKCGFINEGLLRSYYPSRRRGLLDVYMFARVA